MFTSRSRVIARLGAVRGASLVFTLSLILLPTGRAAAQKSLLDYIPPRLSAVTPCGGM
jgi:hypothetical protein